MDPRPGLTEERGDEARSATRRSARAAGLQTRPGAIGWDFLCTTCRSRFVRGSAQSDDAKNVLERAARHRCGRRSSAPDNNLRVRSRGPSLRRALTPTRTGQPSWTSRSSRSSRVPSAWVGRGRCAGAPANPGSSPNAVFTRHRDDARARLASPAPRATPRPAFDPAALGALDAVRDPRRAPRRARTSSRAPHSGLDAPATRELRRARHARRRRNPINRVRRLDARPLIGVVPRVSRFLRFSIARTSRSPVADLGS